MYAMEDWEIKTGLRSKTKEYIKKTNQLIVNGIVVFLVGVTVGTMSSFLAEVIKNLVF